MDADREKGRNTTRESRSEQNFSPFVVYFTPRSSHGSAKEALKIGGLLYLPAAPTGRDAAC